MEKNHENKLVNNASAISHGILMGYFQKIAHTIMTSKFRPISTSKPSNPPHSIMTSNFKNITYLEGGPSKNFGEKK